MEAEELQQARENKRALQNLVKSRGWELLANLAEAQIESRKTHMAQLIVSDMDTVAEHNYTRGEKDSLNLFLQMPQLLIDEADDFIEETKDE